MRLYKDGDGFDAMRKDFKFTPSMLKASKVHVELAKPLDEHLARWKALDNEREAVDDGEVEANAAIAWVDLKLDAATERFSAQLLGDCGGKRDHATFKTFFTKTATELKRLGLKSQVEAMRRFSRDAEDVKLSKASATILKELEALFNESELPLKQREGNDNDRARLARRQAQWRDEANKLRRSVKAALDDYAATNDLPADYADAFFPAAPAKKPATKKPAGGGTTPDDTPDEG
jgi:hypothetical protein